MKLSRLVLLSILISVAMAAQVAADPVVLQFEGGTIGSTLRLRAISADGTEKELLETLGEDRQLHLPLEVAPGWKLAVESEGFWAEPQEILSSPVAIALWPAATFELTLVAPRSTAVPREATLRLTRAEGVSLSDRRQPVEAELACATAEQGRVTCQGPSGHWDLRVKCAGYVPWYSWGHRIAAGETLDLGRVPLRPGLSLLGRVVTEEGPADPSRASVQARPRFVPGGEPLELPPGIEMKTLSARLNVRGYFFFDALAPGSYEIVAQQEGFENASSVAEIAEGQDVEMPAPLVLERPLRLQVRLDPPTDSDGAAWTVVLRADRPGTYIDIAQGPTTSEGEWSSPPISAGAYTLFVESAEGNVLAVQEVELARGSQTVSVDIDLVQVVGTLKIGEMDLAGDLWFGGETGAVHIHAVADADGAFALVLPRAGTWKVDVREESTGIRAKGIEVEVDPPRPGKAAAVEIVLPDTEIRGSVRDEESIPVADAEVMLLPGSGTTTPAFTATDDLGKYSIRGQAEGAYSIHASKGTASSEEQQVQLDEKLAPLEIDLVLLEKTTLHGIAVAAGSPVAGAEVLGFSMTASGSAASGSAAQARTDLDGTFDLRVPRSATSARIVVGAPGYTLSVSRVDLTDLGATVMVPLDRPGGRLELERSADVFSDRSRLPLVLIDGEAIPLHLLESWTWAHDPNLSTDALLAVERMPAARYAYCTLGWQEAMLVAGGAAYPDPSVCAEGDLAPGGVLRLSRPR